MSTSNATGGNSGNFQSTRTFAEHRDPLEVLRLTACQEGRDCKVAVAIGERFGDLIEGESDFTLRKFEKVKKIHCAQDLMTTTAVSWVYRAAGSPSGDEF